MTFVQGGRRTAAATGTADLKVLGADMTAKKFIDYGAQKAGGFV